jgi:ABC-2 type transport system permease protein/sodium transport system permease protein
MSLAPQPSSQLSPAAQMGRLLRLVRKECREILRDRRTLFTLVLMPLLLYPPMGLVFGLLLGDDGGRPIYVLGFRDDHERQTVDGFLFRGGQLLARQRQRAFLPGDRPPDVPDLRGEVCANLEDDVRHGRVDVGIRPLQAMPSGLPPLDRDLALEWELLYREDSVYSREAVSHVQRLCNAFNAEFLSLRLGTQGIKQRPMPVRTLPLPLREPEANPSFSLAVLVPLVLIVMTITGAVYPAIDLTAGERERGTLEILVAAPIPRKSLLLAKYVAVLAVAVLTALVNLVAMFITLQLSGMGHLIFGPRGVSLLVVVEVFGLLLLFAAFFAAVLLALTSFTRSFKEAQAYLVPLMLVSLAPALLGLMPGLDLTGPLAVVPLLNIVLLSRDLFEGNARLGPALVVVGSTLAYAFLAIAVAARIFGAEAVLYSESGGLRNLFRRG